MKKLEVKHVAGKLIMSLITGGELMVIADLGAAWFEKALPLCVFFIGWFGITILLMLFRKCTARMLLACVVSSCMLIGLCGAGLFGLWKCFSDNAVYQEADNGKTELYAGHNVMVFIPHQDDELDLLGGVFENYVKYGSTVRVVFATTGDYYDIGETRMREALQVMQSIGIPEENVIFLGFGNEWESISSIYYGQPDEVHESHAGYTESYGLPEHSAYQEGTPYTRENLIQLMADVIMEYQPDTLFCTDLDEHIDHRMLSFLFEEAVGRVLASQSEYKPLVFKGFSYPTALFAASDYYSLNMRATKGPTEWEYWSDANIFRWSERIRFPVNAGCLSRSLYSSSLYKLTKLYASQYFHQLAVNLINGDRVFWQRETGSVLYNAEFSVSSGEPVVLNDFNLIASEDGEQALHAPYSGVWMPDSADTEKTVKVTLAEPADLTRIVLYDSYSLNDNILDAEVVFPSGNVYATGALRADGSGTEIKVDEKAVSSFTVRVLSSEGAGAGLSEIEAYTGPAESFAEYIKLEDTDGNFAYDYQLDGEDAAQFRLYSVGCSSDPEKYKVQCDNEKCQVKIQGDFIVIDCPKGQKCVLTVSDPEGTISDSVTISHEKALNTAGMKLEETFYLNSFKYEYFRESAVFSVLRWVRHLFTDESLSVDLPGVTY